MKFLIASILGLSMLNVNAADITKSEMKLRKCVATAYTTANESVSKSDLSSRVKVCKESVRVEAKAEKAAKRGEKIRAQIAKLQSKLNS